jgi:hypothetical protein
MSMLKDFPNNFKKYLKSERIKYIDLDNLKDITHRKPDFIVSKNNIRAIIELKEASYTPEEVSRFNIQNNLLNLLNKLNFNYCIKVNIDNLTTIHGREIHAIYNIMKNNINSMNSNKSEFQILVPNDFDLRRTVKYEEYSNKNKLIKKIITYGIKNHSETPYKFSSNINKYFRINNKLIKPNTLESYKFLIPSKFIFSATTIKNIKKKGFIGFSEFWWENPDILKKKLIGQFKDANNQFKIFKKNRKFLNILDTVIVVSIRNIYINSIIYEHEKLFKIISEIFKKESFSGICKVAFFDKNRIIYTFKNPNYSRLNNG